MHGRHVIKQQWRGTVFSSWIQMSLAGEDSSTPTSFFSIIFHNRFNIDDSNVESIVKYNWKKLVVTKVSANSDAISQPWPGVWLPRHRHFSVIQSYTILTNPYEYNKNTPTFRNHTTQTVSSGTHQNLIPWLTHRDIFCVFFFQMPPVKTHFTAGICT